MANHFLKFYPVNNGDTVLITLSDETTILVDCKIRTSAEDTLDKEKYDVKKDLLNNIRKRDNNPFVDVFILTHPDQDHCLGFATHFYCGDPSKYTKENRDNDEILIDEMWVTSMLFECVNCEDGKAVRKEAERRKKLWDENSSEKDKPGNRICMIGYNGDEKFHNVEAYIPGDTITEINNKNQTNVEFFVHAPFKKSLVTASADKDNNFSSIAMQARFKVNASDSDFSTYFLFGGDADHYRWKEILDQSKKHGNEDKLKWDIFLSPHHCSWTYFNDVPYAENKTPKDYSLTILDYKVGKGKIVASSKVIKNDEDNPPHWAAKQEYLKKLDSNDNFLELATIPSSSEPKPVTFKVTPQGPIRDESSKQGSSTVSAGGSIGAVNTKTEYGS